jgi:hypothetical protein
LAQSFAERFNNTKSNPFVGTSHLHKKIITVNIDSSARKVAILLAIGDREFTFGE